MNNRSTKNVGWKTVEICSLTGATPRQIRYWVEKRLVGASLSTSNGRGSTLRFSLKDLLVVMVILEARAKGVSIRHIRKTVQQARERWNICQPLSELRIACLAKSLLYKKGGVYLDSLSGQQVFDLALEKIKVKLGSSKAQEGEELIREAVDVAHELLERA